MDVSRAAWLNCDFCDFRGKKFDYQYDSNNYYNLFILGIIAICNRKGIITIVIFYCKIKSSI